MSLGIKALRYAEGGQTPQTLQEKARIRRIMQEIAMDGEAPDKRPDGQPDIRKVGNEWIIMVGGKPRKPLGMAAGGQSTVIPQTTGSAGNGAQSSLRGRYVIPPPPGYIPGFNPEMQYFQDDPENPVIPPYRAPWDTNLYAGSPLNRFNPSGNTPYFESIIPGAQQPPARGGGPRGGTTPGGIGSLPPAFGGTPGWANPGGGTGSGTGGGGRSGGARTPVTRGDIGASAGPDRGVGGSLRDQAPGGFGQPWGGGSMGGGRSTGGFNDYLNQMIPSGAQQGSDPNALSRWLIEHPRLAGSIAGSLTGVPGMGMLAKQLTDRYWQNNAWQSPAPPYESTATQAIDAFVNENPGSAAALRELAGGQQSGAAPQREYYGQMGPWTGFDTADGRQWDYRYTGPLGGGSGGGSPTTSAWWALQDNAAGGKVTLKAKGGPVKLQAGGIANVPSEYMQPQQQPDEQDLQMVAAAITGEAGEQADAIINMFIEKYGPEMFQQVREMVLQSIAPNAQTEGMVQGQGGGMDDQVPGMIGNQQPVAVSPGEYIVPADVVSGLGDGSSDAGAQELDRMSGNVRMARHGGQMQPPPIDARRVMPA
jgi:hypothetical protein